MGTIVLLPGLIVWFRTEGHKSQKYTLDPIIVHELKEWPSCMLWTTSRLGTR